MTVQKKFPKTLVILIWNLGIGGVQKRIKDIVIDMSINHPEWRIVILVKNRYPQCFNQIIEKLPNVIVHYFSPVDSATHDKTIKRSPLPWIISHTYLYNPQTCLSFLSHFSVLLILFKLCIFWRKPKIVLNEVSQTTNYLKFNAQFPLMEKWLIRLLYRFADTIITPSKAGLDDLHNTYWVPQKKLLRISNWTLFTPTKPKKKTYDLVYIGRFEKEKNILGVIQILALIKKNIPRVRLALVGEGSQLPEINHCIQSLKLQKNIAIIPTKTNIKNVLQQSKLFILNSQSEGLPNVVLEAALCQVPTIAYNFAGAEEIIVHGKTGYLANTSEKLALLTNELLNDPGKIAQFGKEAQIFISQNFHKKNQDLFIKIITE